MSNPTPTESVEEIVAKRVKDFVAVYNKGGTGYDWTFLIDQLLGLFNEREIKARTEEVEIFANPIWTWNNNDEVKTYANKRQAELLANKDKEA